MHGTEEASNDGRVRVRIIHGFNISHKELTYLLQKSTSHQKPSTRCMLLGGQIGRKRPSLVPTATHKEDNQRTPHVSNLLHNVYHTCMLRDLQTSTQVFLKFIITQLARLLYYHVHISKQLSSIKLILVFYSLKRKFHIS